MFEMLISEQICDLGGKEGVTMKERHRQMIAYLKQEKRASVKKLADHFYVSEMTVRRDLRELEQQGYLSRYPGGALLSREDEPPIALRRLLRSEEKQKLSRLTRKHLKDSLTVFLDSSSTCTYLVPHLAEFKEIKVVTNSIPGLLQAAKHQIPCVMAGGDYYVHDMCTVGSETESFLRNINVDVAFFSALGISDDGLITDLDERQTAVRKAVMENAKKKLFLLDHSKQHKKFLYTLCRVEDADEIIML